RRRRREPSFRAPAGPPRARARALPRSVTQAALTSGASTRAFLSGWLAASASERTTRHLIKLAASPSNVDAVAMIARSAIVGSRGGSSGGGSAVADRLHERLAEADATRLNRVASDDVEEGALGLHGLGLSQHVQDVVSTDRLPVPAAHVHPHQDVAGGNR